MVSAYGIDLANPSLCATPPGISHIRQLIQVHTPHKFDWSSVRRGSHLPDPEAAFRLVAERVADSGLLF
jgi:hypothetical protein